MLVVQYNGPAKTIGHAVWYPGETRQASAKQLAAWQTEHGDVFVVVGGAEPATEPAPTEEASTSAIVIEDDAAQVFDSVEAADQVTEPKAKRK